MKLALLIIFAAIQSICYSQVDTLLLRNRINRIENDNKKINQRIDELIKSTDLQIMAEKKTVDSLNNKIITLEVNYKRLTEEYSSLKKDFENEKRFKDRDIENISSKFNTSNIIGIFIAIIILGVIVFFLIIIVKKFKESNKTVEEKALKIDKELLELMSRQIDITKEVKKNNREEQTTKETDHSFAIRVADEINRINMRIAKMDKSSRDVQAVTNALKRMESELNQQGYEIIIRNGEEYKDTMTFLPVNYIAIEGLKSGAQVIHRTIKPQITYKSQLIQQGEIEIGVNENDLA